MSQTLIGGTAYTINHGNTLVGGTAYTIDHGKTLVGGTSYDIELAGAASVPYSLSDWPGWSSATWEDVNNLCYAKQQGYIDSWPSDVTLGKTKNINFTQEALDYYDLARNATNPNAAILIDRDIDGAGTLTFMIDLGANNYRMGQDRVMMSANVVTRKITQGIYFIEVRKGTASSSATASYSNVALFAFSSGEMNISGNSLLPLSDWTSSNSESTQGVLVPYAYFNTGNSTTDIDHRKAKNSNGAWLRSNASGNYYAYVTGNGVGSYDYMPSGNTKGQILGFVVGNPSAQTIE